MLNQLAVLGKRTFRLTMRSMVMVQLNIMATLVSEKSGTPVTTVKPGIFCAVIVSVFPKINGSVSPNVQ